MNIFDNFLESANQNKDRIAVIYDGKEYSYFSLLETVNNIAEELINHGISEGDIVALHMRCSFLSVASLLAVWKIGASVLPFDEDTPDLRARDYLLQSQAKLLLFEKDGELHKEVLKTEISYKRVGIAYVMFTSGSTGKPKGVIISCKNILSLLEVWKDYYGLSHFQPRVLQLSSISTDMFIGNLIKSLFFSGTLIIVNKEDKLNLNNTVEIISKWKPNIIESIPSYVRILLEQLKEDVKDISFLKQIVVGGEACSRQEYKWIIDNYPLARVINGYGLTECTIESVVYEAKQLEYNADEQQMVIGFPFKNTQVFIVNSNLELLQDSERGELLIGGDGVSPGYMDETMNDGKFIVFNGIYCYRTGDIVQKMSSGELLFLGRDDDQIQVSGYRVELSEISRVLTGINGVKEAVALNVGQNIFSPKIVAFVVATVDKQLIFKEMMSKLPEQMVPVELILLGSIPKTISGKIDRQSLIDSFNEKFVEVDVKYQTKNPVVSILEEVLGKSVAMDISIAEQGADSLAMIKILHKLKQKGFSVKIADIYSTDSVNSFIQLLEVHVEKDVPLKYSGKEETINSDFIQTTLAQLRQKEIVFFNQMILSGIESKIDLDLWKTSFRTIQREKYNIDYLWFDNMSFDVLIQRHFCLMKEQELLKSTLSKDDKLSWVVFKLHEVIEPVVLDVSAYNFEEVLVMKMLPFIKEYYLLKDKLSDFPYRHFFVKVSKSKFLYVFCMDESIHNKIGSDIVKSYFSLGPLGNKIQYGEYLKLLRKGSLLGEADIVKEFRLDEFNDVVAKFPEYSQDEIMLHEHEFEADNKQDSFMQSLEIFKKILNSLIESDVPFFMVQDTRAYKDNKFIKTIGEFTDFIPCVMRQEQSTEQLGQDLNSLRKRATLSLTNIKSIKWLADKYEHPVIKKFAESVRLEREGMEKVVIFHYRTEIDDSTELFSTNKLNQDLQNSWPSAITFNFAPDGDKLFLSSYLPCNKERWLDITEEIENGKI